MGQALYRKYRSRNLGEIVGQEHITRTLQQALKTGRISHAYLFTGPRGVGKTSIARILAHEINGLPYDDDSMHMDIIEIDAASNRRIDDARELRDKIHIAPTSAKYKVYIIDEVHMLTREAFNALLKTLEEPPAHAVFILATTEAHKLPETIVSRTQRYIFRPVDEQQVVKHLAEIAKTENISIDEAALGHLARAGEGSFRDSISLLDQASSLPGLITEQAILDLLGVVPATLLGQLVQALASASSSSQLLGVVEQLFDQGYQAPQVSHQLVSYLRDGLLQDNLVLPLDKTIALIDALLSVPTAHDPARQLEIILLGHTANLKAVEPIVPVASIEVPKPQPKIVAEKLPETPQSAPIAHQTKKEPAEVKKATIKPKKISPGDLDAASWNKVVDTVRTKYYTLYSVLKTAIPTFNGDEVELGFDFAFHQKRINDVKNKSIIAGIIHDITGRNVSITCVKHTSEVAATSARNPKAPPESITNIFGGGELLKS
jgi:DNA polymerase-3 subunit gamma/tau